MSELIDFPGFAQEVARANALLSHIKNGGPRAINSALNRTITGVRTDLVRSVRDNYDVKASDVRNAMQLKKSNPSTLTASIGASGAPLPLINFRVKPAQPGKQKPGSTLRVSVKKSGGKPIKGAFVAKLQGGRVGVAIRVGKARLPLKELHGPSVPQMLGEANLATNVMSSAQERFLKRIAHEVDWLLEKGK
ncbi:phage tail protein [Pelosinus sp. IPA-1]|uniref:phage tail protein n=1 Tax=Pelosinus sp. IPA-1 TaxID=3029569 RepID=UPI0024361CA6|nr:phage tail protein [Pelosinus sp. IPA-1]GMB00433.1 hypothetical protein PIPA1_32320 [Pelosinus sp. IPA-1]